MGKGQTDTRLDTTPSLVLAEQVRALYAKAHLAFLAVVINAGILVGILWSQRPRVLLVGWLVSLGVLTAIRGWSWRSYRSAPQPPDAAAVWGRRFALGSLANGVLWGMGGWLLYVPGGLPYQVLVAFVLGGMCAGAVTSTSSYPAALYGFIVPCMSPLAIRLLLDGDAVHLGMGAMGLLFALLLVAIGRTGSRQLVEAVRLRLEREDLAERLARATSSLEAANRSLAARVERGTSELEATRADKRRSEAAVARFRALLDQHPAAIFVADATDLTLIDFNGSALRLIGLEADLAMGKPLWELDICDELSEEERWQRLVRQLEASEHVTVEAMSPHSRPRHQNLEIDLALHKHEDASYVLVMVHDVSDRKRLESEVAQTRLLATLGRLSTGVAHEVNNPLTYVVTNLDFVADRLSAGSDEVSEALSEAREGAERIRTIVGDLTALAHREPERVGALDIHQVLRSCAKVLGNELRHRAQLVLKLDAPPLVLGNRTRLSQVFLNLLTNAIQAIEPGNAATGVVEVATAKVGPLVRVTVTDNGQGIHPSALARIFEPFYTTKDIGQGTGLGLAIARTIVEGLGGTIEARSSLAEGTTFTVDLPAARSDAPEAPISTPARAAPPPSSGRSARILVIDDDRLVARSLERTLRPHRVDTMHNAREALERLVADPDAYDVVFCDVLMPELTGTELYQRVRDVAPATASRFIFVTGATTADARAFLASVPNPCVYKPFDPQQVRSAMHAQLESARAAIPA